MTATTGLIRDLRALVGDEAVSHDPVDQLAYSRDLWPKGFLWLRSGRHTVHPPQAIVWPGSVQEAAAVVRTLGRAGIPIIPFGAGSGVCGGTLPIRGGVVVDVKRLDRIRTVDPMARRVDVEAGRIGEDLEQALAGHGFTLGHFPASIYCSTVGGWIAARSAGQMSTLYGKIEDMVSEVGCLTSDGEYHRVPGRPVRGQGPGFCQLLVGSEGIYALLTDARLRIRPVPAARRFRAFRVSHLEDGLEAIRRVMQAGLRPAVVRLYDAPDSLLMRSGAVQGTRTKRPGGLNGLWRALGHRAQRALMDRPSLANLAIDRLPDTAFGGCLLVFVFEGLEKVVQTEERAVCDLIGNRAEDLGPAPAQHWFRNRYAVSYRQSRVFMEGGFNDTMEVAATWDRLLDMYRAVRAALRHKVVVLAHFSHAYLEGCSIYFTFAGAADSDEAAEDLYDDTWRTALAAVMEAGGVISHHHGVGISKAGAMEGEYGGALDIAWSLKRTFDPLGVMNPGKLLGSRERVPAAPAVRRSTAGAVQAALEAVVPGGVVAEGDGPVFTVTPGDAVETAGCFRVATENGVPVTAHSQTPGPAVGIRGPRMVVSLERMQAVREVSTRALAVHAEAGIRAHALEEALNEHDLTLGCALLPDVSPKLGGLLGGYGWGEPAGSAGDIHEACIGLEAVLPRGRSIRIKPAPRRAAGPDLMQALLGTEGAFGIITAAWLRVGRTPRTRLLLGRWVPDTATAVRLLAGLLADSVRPTLARIVRPGPAWATTPMRGEAGIVLVFEGEGSIGECFQGIAAERIAAAGGEEMAEAEPLRSRSPIEMPTEPERGIERIEAAGRWTELLALDGEAATLFGDDLVSCRLSHALPEGGVATWTVLAAPARTAPDRRPAFRLLGRLAERDVVLRAYRGPAAVPPRLLRRTQAGLRPWMETLKKDLDPAGISNPGALGLP